MPETNEGIESKEYSASVPEPPSGGAYSDSFDRPRAEKKLEEANVLIADDSSTVRAYVEYILRERNYRPLSFVNGKELFDYLSEEEEKACDIILLDSEMPVMDGLATLKALKSHERLKGIPVLFLSALVDKSQIVTALRSGADDYIAKPFPVDELFARINVHLKISAMQKEIVEQRDDLSVALGDLRKSNQLLLKIFGIIAHDLRGPIGNFATFLDLVLEKTDEISKEEAISALQSIKGSSRSVFDLLDNLLNWSRCQRGEIAFQFGLHEVRGMIAQGIEALTTTAANKRIELLCDVEPGIEAWCDRFAVTTVVRNLVSNAIKFTPRGGRIRFEVSKRPDSMVEISVFDNGVGIKPEDMSRLFNAYEHFTTWGTDKERGTGLGLNLCHYFVTKNSGRIWVDSEAGKGTVFHFTLPTRKPERESPSGAG